MTKHTPGPWVVGEPHPTNACAYVCNDEGQEVATIYYCSEGGVIGKDGIWPEQPNRDANARLIAAAPDLLEALKAILDETGGIGGPFTIARAAIAKATGG